MTTKLSYSKPLAEVIKVCFIDLKIFAKTRTHAELTDLFMECFSHCVIAGEDDRETISAALYHHFYSITDELRANGIPV